ncbi:hypothetical protein CAC42_7998 [Sphaceloma murrayae]|uniref:non-specific serine/threonine protein kinase n=1 Tax=Sphaceloma murrayae TaxID=2082308 RepID=A0A2K1QLQ3_9PEZI|nr:hypothetical protein CAC42_7998 [Sphaceloma murrayae]
MGPAVTNGAGHEHDEDHVPPPSTLAAQLVREHAPDTRQTVTNPSAPFDQLINEILHNDRDPETDPQINYQAIRLVVKLGLDTLSTDDNPFERTPRLLAQAQDSISVVDVTVQRQPELLFFTENDGQTAPLVVWLFARLLHAATHRKYLELHVQIANFLGAVIRVLSRSLQYWQFAKSILSFYQDAVDDILDKLEEQPRLSAKMARSMDVNLPATRSISRLTHGSGLTVAITSDAQITVTTLRDTLVVAAILARACAAANSSSEDQAGGIRWARGVALLMKRSMVVNQDILGSDFQECSNLYDSLETDLHSSNFSQASASNGIVTVSGYENRSRGTEITQVSSSYLAIERKILSGSSSSANDTNITKETASTLKDSEREQLFLMVIMAVQAPSLDIEASKRLGNILKSLLDYTELKGAGRCAVLAVKAINAYATYSRADDHLDLSSSTLGQWCVKSITQPSRELRMNAADALIAFLREDLTRSIRDKNRREALAIFRKLSTRREPSQHLGLIHAWGRVVVVCGERERNLALLELVKYLGDGLDLISGSAAYELERVSSVLGLEPERLMRPYWKTVAASAVNDLFTKPQKVQLLAAFLGLTVDQFLVLTRADTIPFLVLTKRKDVLRRIAAAQSSAALPSRPAARRIAKVNPPKNLSVGDIIVQPVATLAGTLSLLLRQNDEVLDAEEYVTAVLSDCVPEWTEGDICSLLRMEAVSTMLELLKAAGDEEDPARKPAVFKAIQDFAIIIERQSANLRSKPAKLLGIFFESHVLGLITQASNELERSVDIIMRMEKVRCLKAIEEMINLAPTHITFAIPQIRAYLQAAIDQGGLIDPAMSAWLALMNNSGPDNVVGLLGHLFSIVVQHWSDISADVQQRTYDTIANLLKTHSDPIRDEVIRVPSLAAIPLMSKFEAEISRLKSGESPQRFLQSYIDRLQDENASIVLQAGRELLLWLKRNQSFVHDGAVSEPPMPIILTATRALLDACVKYNPGSMGISDVCAQCLGVIGCLDPNRMEETVAEPHALMLSNLEQKRESSTWVALLFTDVLVPAFKSATNAKSQGFLAYVMQELLKAIGFKDVDSARLRSSQGGGTDEAWLKMPEGTRSTLVTFLHSRYVVTAIAVEPATYPIFSVDIKHGNWLRQWVYDMLWRGKGDNPKMLFQILARVIRSHDLSISKFLLPYVTLNIVLGGDAREVDQIAQEMLVVLSTESSVPTEQEVLRQCSEDIFSILDYMTRWAQEKKRQLAAVRIQLLRAGHSPDQFEESTALGQIESVESLTSSIPANIIAQRAIECGSYTRALFHWENFIREQKDSQDLNVGDRDAMYTRLQEIYSEIDEPDGLDGIAAQMNLLTPEQQAWQHLQAGRWTAAQSWYDIELMSKPDDRSAQEGLLMCLQQSGQANHVIRVARDLAKSVEANSSWRQRLLSFTAEAAWSSGCLHEYASDLEAATAAGSSIFNVSLGRILLDVAKGNIQESTSSIVKLRNSVTRSISSANAASLSSCHTQMLQLHVLEEVEQVQELRKQPSLSPLNISNLSTSLDKRLAVLGTSMTDKQFVLGVRRAVLKVTQAPVDLEVGKLWVTTARLARKANIDNAAHFAVICASKCGEDSSTIEQARMMWKNGQHRQAIHCLQGAIDSDIFTAYDRRPEITSVSETPLKQNTLAARAHLLLAKWLDASGQTQTQDVTATYQFAAKNYAKWEKGHYYLGKHYNNLLEAEKALPAGKQSDSFLSGETVKLVIENYLRSIPFGSKYWYQTLPKLITLWLDLGMDCISKPKELSQDMFDRRNKFLNHTHSQIKKYYDRVPRYVFFTALPQLISRISHPNAKVADVLSHIISGIVSCHPQQGLWALLPVARATSTDRASRGREIISRLRDSKSKSKSDTRSGLELKSMVMRGQRLQDGLLHACEVHFEARSSNASLSRDLGFNHQLAPNPLVVPFQHTLTPNIPTVQDTGFIRHFKAFAVEPITITAFQDDVLVLNSLQKPRKLTLRGSDGKSYGILCKPKDDLRKDQRLMEFNTMINRALKRSPESSKRRLYIKTYGVTPLSEESGAIEWVEGIKPLRDILLKLYARKGISPNYAEIRGLLNEACSTPANYPIFTRKILCSFPAVLHEWFTETFPSPSSWFASRLRYTRTAAVMSMVGHVLGLGDRHGENILLEESHGGVFHVDFNCLFDKGLMFEKPELVPFRLTHNMVDAMGPVLGVEGPFRTSAELTLRLLRENQDTLMNVLETFLHDPTADFVGRRKRASVPGVPETPREVYDSVSQKLRGYLRGESVPLSVEGMVQALIGMARDEGNLCRMYIGWCAFL